MPSLELFKVFLEETPNNSVPGLFICRMAKSVVFAILTFSTRERPAEKWRCLRAPREAPNKPALPL